MLNHQTLDYKGVFPQSYDVPIRINKEKNLRQFIDEMMINLAYKKKFRINFLEKIYQVVASNKNTMNEVKYSNLLLRSLSIICFLRKNE